MMTSSLKFRTNLWAAVFGLAAVLAPAPLAAAPGETVTTPEAIPELPIEVETEVGPAGSLKKIPLWKETVEFLEYPHAMVCPEDDPATLQFDESSVCVATTKRRPGFGTKMPPLDVLNPCFNVLTGQPLRMRPDEEIDWNQPGPLFDPDEVVEVGPGNVPTELRTVIGYLVVVDESHEDECYTAGGGCLAVANPGPEIGVGIDDQSLQHDAIPPDGTIIAEPACNTNGKRLVMLEDGVEVEELEQPVNENHFIKNRLAAEVLGKAAFWDMQIGSDGVQACGSCHFHAGVDNRTRNQLNPNTFGSAGTSTTLEIFSNRETPPPFPEHSNQDVVANDFPFHKLEDVSIPGEPMLNPENVVSDADDVMSSMGVSEFTRFDDILIGKDAFGPAFKGVKPLLPDLGTPMPEPIPSMIDENGNKLRRVEPRNTPTFHSAAFNFDNFWDGRARHDFNGGSVFGPADPFFHVYVNCRRKLRELAAPAEAEGHLCKWTEKGGNYLGADEGEDPVPVRIRFSSLASQAMGPPLSDFEMAFFGRNWAKIGKKMLQYNVTPLANQLVDPKDSRLGPWSWQGGRKCNRRKTAIGKPGLCISYRSLIKKAFRKALWSNSENHLIGKSVPMNADCEPGEQIEAGETPTCDPFDGYVLKIAKGSVGRKSSPNFTNKFTQMEANFSLFFGLAVQAYEQLTIPDETPWDRFNDVNPKIGNAVAQPGEQGTLPPDQIRELVTGDPDGSVTLVKGFGPDEVFGFDIFAGGNVTAALPTGPRNPEGFGSNPFLRTARCMLCHLGPEQSDHTNNVNAGLLQSGTEREFPTPPTAAEPTGVLKLVTGFSLAEEVEENAQDGVEVENRNFAFMDDPNTPWDDAQVAQGSGIAFQDNGIYNIGVRPTDDDILRGGDDPFGWPLALSALAFKNLGGEDFEPCDTLGDDCDGALPNFDPAAGPGGGLYETVGNCAGCDFEGTGYFQESINPGLDLEPADPQLPEYLAEWANNLPAGEANPLIDELAFAPNTLTPPPSAEYTEILFGADLHCGVYDPAAFGEGPPNFGWGPLCPNSQTGVPVNLQLADPASGDASAYQPGSLVAPPNGTWPFANRVARNGAAKVPQLRNVELTGPYFHTGSYLTLRQIIDFYMRAGDFPVTNAEDRDPNLVNIDVQAFGFGTTIGLPPEFMDGIPDVISQYGPMPDTDPPGCAADPPNCTPEPDSSTPDEAREAMVKFLLALTDERVAHRSAPFDQPEIFVPLDGRAPANTGGRAQLLKQTGTTCDPGDPTFTGDCFQQVPATGKHGQHERLEAFLGVARAPGDGIDHFDQ